MLEIKDLKIGDIIYESQYGLDYETLVLSSPKNKDDGWYFIGLSSERIITFFQAHDCGPYYLRLYNQPVYDNVYKLDGVLLAKALNFYMQNQEGTEFLKKSYAEYEKLLKMFEDTEQ